MSDNQKFFPRTFGKLGERLSCLVVSGFISQSIKFSNDYQTSIENQNLNRDDEKRQNDQHPIGQSSGETLFDDGENFGDDFSISDQHKQQVKSQNDTEDTQNGDCHFVHFQKTQILDSNGIDSIIEFRRVVFRNQHENCKGNQNSNGCQRNDPEKQPRTTQHGNHQNYARTEGNQTTINEEEFGIN